MIKVAPMGANCARGLMRRLKQQIGFICLPLSLYVSQLGPTSLAS